MSDIVVVGSINMDIINKVQSFPAVGETIPSVGTEFGPGGKGANQAAAAIRCGSSVTLMGAVGKDSFGVELLTLLEKESITTEHIIKKDGLTRLAFITVDASGSNHIILSSGANGTLNAAEDFSLEELDFAQALIVQNEIPWEVTQFMIEEACKRKVKVIVNPAPVDNFPVDILPMIDLLVVNEHEAEAITGISVNGELDAIQAANHILLLGGNSVVITLGEKGVVYLDKNAQLIKRKAFKVRAVDTTAAGDTFIGFFSSSLITGKTIQDSLDFASAAAALTVTRKGAIESIPSYEEVQPFIGRN
jgi:ribokinase